MSIRSLAISSIAAVSAVATSDSTLLREASLLMTHDSGTGFIGKNDVRKDFAMTQTVNLVEQLYCGARALDIRLAQRAYDPLEIFGTRRRKINYHHGKVPAWISDQNLDNTVEDLVKWAQAHPDELVMLITSHTYHSDSVGALAGDGHMTHDSTLMSTIEKNYKKFGVRWEFDCDTVNGWTMEEAKAAALMDYGGRMIVLNEDCMWDAYNSDIDAKSKVLGYIKDTISTGSAMSKMYTTQAFIQQHGSPTVPLSADLNHDILSWIGEGIFSGVNLVEVNNICSYGPEIAQKLGTTVSNADVSACMSACRGSCDKYSGSPFCDGFHAGVPRNSSSDALELLV